MPWPFGRKAAVAVTAESEDASKSPSARFAFKLFRELSRGEATANLFFSPSSVMLCLALVYELASRETRHQISEALEIASLSQAGLESEISSLKTAFGARADAEVSFANSLWLGRHAQIAGAFEARLRELYDPFLRTDRPFLVMSPESAEMTKYVANCLLATKISFINEMANLCEAYGADINEVRRGIGHDSRIGFSFLFPGVGYGGSCFPKDIRAIIHMAQSRGLPARMMEAVDAVNEA